MRTSLIILLFLFAINSHAQFEFEPGYFIDNDGVKTECLVKNMAWKITPNEIEYKLDPSSEIKNTNLNNIKEFGIDGQVKFERHKILIDKYNDKLGEARDEALFDYHEDNLFLQIIEEGDAILYKYNSFAFTRFFFKQGQLPVTQLVYKSHIRTEELNNTKLEYARKFRVQLYQALNCPDISINETANVRFSENALIKIIRKYNICKSGLSTNYYNSKQKNLINLRARGAIGMANISGKYTDDRIIEAFKNQISFRLSLEIEFVATYLDGRFSFTVEPGFFHFSKRSESLLNRGAGQLNLNILQLPLGVKFNQKLSSKSKLYFTLLNDMQFPIFSSINYDDNPIPTKIKTNLGASILTGYAIGVGFNYNNFNIELRHHLNRTTPTSTSTYDLRYNVTDLILGYQF